MLTFGVIITIYLFILILSFYYCSKPKANIIKKYGYPKAHFSTQKCWKTVPIRGTIIDMDFFDGFIVISEGKEEYILNKEFKNFKFYGSYFTLVFECTIKNSIKQILLTRKQKKMLELFFDI